MYKVTIHKISKYFFTYSAARAYARAVGKPNARIIPIH